MLRQPNIYRDRKHAGEFLASLLLQRGSTGSNALVLALPRGGVPVAAPIAKALKAPLDLLLVRKLGIPGDEEVAMGAISVGGVCFLNSGLIEALGIPSSAVDRVKESENAELKRRNVAYRDSRPPPDVSGKVVYLVDDGIATGATVQAALLALHEMRPDKIVLVAPVGAPDSIEDLARLCDEMIVPLQPQRFSAVGLWYKSFDQTQDSEVLQLLRDS
ncbi:hypothetical protein HDU78_000104 [Chytriomyces hyalinus]|nr:hypothetical protein HDU78_000104 [Chytriomyces hyalinus]KAJ3263632.1 hypothetical protein HDU77_010279 [Chytriomyces hyalinus]